MTQPPYVPGSDPQDPAAPQPPVPWQQPYPQSVQQVVMVQALPTSGWAVAALVFGILGMLGGFCLFAVPCVIAVICGHAGLIETRGGAKSGRGMAIAGMIMGYLFVGPAIAVVAMGGLGAVTS